MRNVNVCLKTCLAGLLLLAFALPLLAQTAPQGTVAQINVNVPKPGMTAQYEAGRKKHMAWHKAQNDSWGWTVWECLTGESQGAFVVGSFGHHWKDFDGREKFDAADSADVNANIGPALAATRTFYFAMLPALSTAAEPIDTPLLSVTHFYLNGDGGPAFTENVRKVADAIKKTGYPAKPSQWYVLANGGTGGHYVLVQARKNYADMEPPEKSLAMMLNDAYGEEGAKILTAIGKAVSRTESELLQYRPDLSYNPARRTGSGGK